MIVFGLTLVYSNITMQLLIYFVVALSLNFVIGYARALSIHHAALFGIGAFTYAVMAQRGWSNDLILCGLAAAVIAAMVSVILAFGSLRISGDYFIVASFAFQFFAIEALFNWTSISGGPNGDYGLPTPTILGLAISSTAAYILVAALLAVATLGFAIWLRRSPYGRLLRAMGDAPSALLTAGFGVLRLKVGVFGISGIIAAVAGVLYAAYLGVAQTATFDVNLAILLVAIVVIGGTGSAVGSLLGAALIAFVQPLLTNLNLSATTTAAVQQLIFAALLVGVVALLPRGLVQLGDLPKLVMRRSRGGSSR
ncbi:MAG: branched-chain amino acid ABC transporter permease [Solirubrobacterales bacterium]|nr:branched-chain amino acid ABC transporter permease [Solirubrobacterales bacterium]MBV9365120.1 branched-chain amino acid ABC transporter permease [Solirubrobacterales bacterium]MBV9810373.1 branched-chain amino acid ABC transporter permease [Solirubrobacterales bacterium]